MNEFGIKLKMKIKINHCLFDVNAESYELIVSKLFRISFSYPLLT